MNHNANVIYNTAVDIPLRQHPWWLRAAIVLTNVCMPFMLLSIVGTILTLAQRTSIDLLSTQAVTLVGYFICVGIGQVFMQRQLESIGLAVGVLLAIAFLAIWFVGSGFLGYMVVFLGFVVMALIRVLNLYRASILTHSNELMFRRDSMFFVPVFLLLGLIQLGAKNVENNDVNSTIVLFSVIYIGLRVWTLWTIHRLESNTGRASRVGILVIIALTVFGVVIGPSLGGIFIRVLMVVGAMGGIIGAILSMFFGTSKHSVKPTPTQDPTKLVKHSEPNHVVNTDDALLFIFVVTALIAAVYTLRYLIHRTKSGSDSKRDHQELAVPARRKWLPTGMELSFLRVVDPVRRRYQQFIKMQHKRGLSMELTETPRQFERRVLEQSPSQDVSELTKRYEQRRYGSLNASEEQTIQGQNE